MTGELDALPPAQLGVDVAAEFVRLALQTLEFLADLDVGPRGELAELGDPGLQFHHGFLEVEVQAQAIAAEGVGEQALGVEARGVDALLREVIGGPEQEVEDGPDSRITSLGCASLRAPFGRLRTHSGAFMWVWTASSSSSRSPESAPSRRWVVKPAR